MSWLPSHPTHVSAICHHRVLWCFLCFLFLKLVLLDWIDFCLYIYVCSFKLPENISRFEERNWQHRLISSSSRFDSDPRLFTLPNTNSTTMPTVNIWQRRKAREINCERYSWHFCVLKLPGGSDFSIRRGSCSINQISANICVVLEWSFRKTGNLSGFER